MYQEEAEEYDEYDNYDEYSEYDDEAEGDEEYESSGYSRKPKSTKWQVFLNDKTSFEGKQYFLYPKLSKSDLVGNIETIELDSGAKIQITYDNEFGEIQFSSVGSSIEGVDKLIAKLNEPATIGTIVES